MTIVASTATRSDCAAATRRSFLQASRQAAAKFMALLSPKPTRMFLLSSPFFWVLILLIAVFLWLMFRRK